MGSFRFKNKESEQILFQKTEMIKKLAGEDFEEEGKLKLSTSSCYSSYLSYLPLSTYSRILMLLK